MDTILKNAVQSIQIGVEDFQSSDSRRVLSAIRNVTAGILLLFKERLSKLSPTNSDEVLIKQKIQPEFDTDGEVTFRGDGKKTVDVQQIRERFRSLNIATDWKRFEKIVSIRNDIEHYCTTESADRLKELLSDSFLIVRDFISNQLGHEPISLLGEKTWNVLLNVADVYQCELEECQKTLGTIEWHNQSLQQMSAYLRCPACHSALVKTADTKNESVFSAEFSCSSCGQTAQIEDMAENALNDCFYSELYHAMKDGEHPPIGNCPDCGRDAFVISEDICGACGGSCSFHECAVCGEELGPGDQDFNGLCGYHHWQAEKDD